MRTLWQQAKQQQDRARKIQTTHSRGGLLLSVAGCACVLRLVHPNILRDRRHEGMRRFGSVNSEDIEDNTLATVSARLDILEDVQT